jgi:hypothetical protein
MRVEDEMSGNFPGEGLVSWRHGLYQESAIYPPFLKWSPKYLAFVGVRSELLYSNPVDGNQKFGIVERLIDCLLFST